MALPADRVAETLFEPPLMQDVTLEWESEIVCSIDARTFKVCHWWSVRHMQRPSQYLQSNHQSWQVAGAWFQHHRGRRVCSWLRALEDGAGTARLYAKVGWHRCSVVGCV
jgi:hypothetical protein